MKKILYIALLAIIPIALNSCSDDSGPEEPDAPEYRSMNPMNSRLKEISDPGEYGTIILNFYGTTIGVTINGIDVGREMADIKLAGGLSDSGDVMDLELTYGTPEGAAASIQPGVYSLTNYFEYVPDDMLSFDRLVCAVNLRLRNINAGTDGGNDPICDRIAVHRETSYAEPILRIKLD